MKISMIMPVYNEAILLPIHLRLASPHLDEIVLIDGSPFGPSTDETRQIASQFRNVTVTKGTYTQPGKTGAWDKRAQISTGVAMAAGDIIIITSVDTVYSDYGMLAETIRSSSPEEKVWYCPSIEFFLDTSHIRLVMQEGGFPLPQIGYIIVARDVFSEQEPAYFKSAQVDPREMVYLHDMVKYHYGWITDFDVQVRKHVRNVKAGWWGEYGESLLKGGEKALEVWAITHILNYTKEIVFPYASLNPHPLKSLEFNRLNNFDRVLEQFQEKYGVDYYNCL